MAAPTPTSLRVVIVTGAGGQGCGRAIAAGFAADGAAVVVSDIDEAGGRSTVELIEAAGGRAAFFPTDVRRDDDARPGDIGNRSLPPSGRSAASLRGF